MSKNIKHLTDEQYRITQQHGTEPAYSGAYWDKKDVGNIIVFVVIHFFFQVKQNMTQDQVGLLFINQSQKKLLENQLIIHFLCKGQSHCAKCNAHLGMFFLMDLNLQV